MKFHFGKVVHEIKWTERRSGYWFKDHGDFDYTFIKYPEDKLIDKTVDCLYGISTRNNFFGFMRLKETK